jgi:hypothetical protein
MELIKAGRLFLIKIERKSSVVLRNLVQECKEPESDMQSEVELIK